MGEGRYGIDVTKVRYIGPIGKVWKLPCMPDFVKGVTKVGGRLIPLIDLRRKLELPEAADRARTCVVGVDVGVPIALAVDSVERVSYYAAHQTRRVVRFGAKIESRAVAGIVTEQDQPCLLLDIDWILMGDSPVRRSDSKTATVTQHVTQSRQPDLSGDRSHTGAEPGSPPRLNGRTVRYCSPSLPQENPPVLSLATTSNTARREHLARLLARPVIVGNRRVPGFRSGNPRLTALATALLQMPPIFRTKEAAPVVASLLRHPPHVYRITHFRYDLGKLRARHLAERLGVRRLYRLTGLGRIVCETFAQRRKVVDIRNILAEALPATEQRSALSA